MSNVFEKVYRTNEVREDITNLTNEASALLEQELDSFCRMHDLSIKQFHEKYSITKSFKMSEKYEEDGRLILTSELIYAIESKEDIEARRISEEQSFHRMLFPDGPSL